MKRRIRKGIRKARKVSIPRRPWGLLSPALKERRQRSLAVLSKMRQGSTLSAAAKEIGVDPRTVTRHLGNTLGKRSGKYLAKSSDRISRGLKIYSDGKQLVITIKDSKAASTIGQYFNAVRKFLGAGDSSGLKYYTNLAVVDSNGIKYRLETNAKKILAIEERKEDPEGFELYDKV